MVRLHLKRGDESQFVLDTTADVSVQSLVQQVALIYNGRLKVERICSGEEEEALTRLITSYVMLAASSLYSIDGMTAK